MNKRDLLSLYDLTPNQIHGLLAQTGYLKRDRGHLNDALEGMTIGLIFQKPSNRTRASFEVGIFQLGGNCLYLGPDEIALGKRESSADVAQTLSRYLDGIVARTFSHQDIIELRDHARIPVVNGLSDLFHPCQALADLFSAKERFGDLKGLTLAFVGDGNNVCHSLLLGCAKTGMHMKVAAPSGYEPDEKIFRDAQALARDNGGSVSLTPSPEKAVAGAQVIYADVWVSMGQEEESKKRLDIFKDYQVNAGLVQKADQDFIFMHCLPAHRGLEVTADIIDGPHSIVFDQAENRMHVQKAVLLYLYEKINI